MSRGAHTDATWNKFRAAMRVRTRIKNLVSRFITPLDAGSNTMIGAAEFDAPAMPIDSWIRHPSPPRHVVLAAPRPTPGTTDLNNCRAILAHAYGEAETEALRTLSIPSLMAFQPATFQFVGFPTTVRDDAELLRYADHNFEAEVPGLYKSGARFSPIGFVNAFTSAEADLASRLRDMVAEMTRTRFGRAVRPMTNLMVQFGPFRCMEALSQTVGRKLAIFEPGPGAGYLGAMLALNGYTYGSYDVTQSLYLWQSHLLDTVTDRTFHELAVPNRTANIDRMAVLHMPWWLFAHQTESTPLRYDLVYSNSNLGEMTKLSFRQLLKFSQVALRDSDVAAFCFFSTGMTQFNTLASIDADLRAAGFLRTMSEPFHCYQLEGRDPELVRTTFSHGIPHIGNANEAHLDAATVFATPRDEAPLDVELTRWFHNWEAPIID